MLTASFVKASALDDGVGFIASTYWLALGDHGRPLPPAFAATFDLRAYDPSAFTRLGIRCPAEIQQAVAKRQAEFLVGRLTAREAMARLDRNVVELGTGLLRQPLWPKGMTGSITHTSSLAAAIAVPSATIRGIGIDIENIVDAASADAIRDIVLTNEEKAIISAMDGFVDPNMLLTIVFSAKESFFKATSSHVGRYFEFHALRLFRLDATSGRMTFTVAENLSPALRTGYAFDACFKVIDKRTILTSFVW
ncbi:MAG: 4'-phosphopantetheinyl transferase family protein [Rhodanobacter sp.]